MLHESQSAYEMYRVRFADGFESDVFADELMGSQKHFHRADYKQKEYKNAKT